MGDGVVMSNYWKQGITYSTYERATKYYVSSLNWTCGNGR